MMVSYFEILSCPIEIYLTDRIIIDSGYIRNDKHRLKKELGIDTKSEVNEDNIGDDNDNELAALAKNAASPPSKPNEGQ